MYKQLIAIDTKSLSFEQAVSFIGNLSRLLYTGTGSSNNFGRQLDVSEVDGLRVLLGVPDSWLMPKRQQVLEMVYAHTFGLTFKAHPEIWTNEPAWSYTNPNATTTGDFETSPV